MAKPSFVDNRNGASGAIAAEAVAALRRMATPCSWLSASDSINTTLYHHLKFDFLRDFVPVGGLVGFPMVMTVSAGFRAKTLPS